MMYVNDEDSSADDELAPHISGLDPYGKHAETVEYNSA